MEEFRKLGIDECILKSIEQEKFETPTRIQRKSIPLALERKDVIVGSATGSGKTLVFGADIIQHSDKGRGIQALVLTPTRELAQQVTTALKRFSRYKHVKIVVVYGGVSINPQIRDLKTADVVVGTPGRILDHIERRTIRLTKVDTLVLDEADRMLDMGFLEDVEKIIKKCPKERQTLLFSATIPPDISHLARRYMGNPVKIFAESYVDPKKLVQRYYDVPDNLKFSLLVHLLKHEKSGLVMVFCNTRRNTDFIAKNLDSAGIDAVAIHGGLSQNRRNSIMKHFHSQKVYVLVCTDVAARGLDIKDVSHIYNYDIPKDSKEYIHRIGRTARAGKEGKVVNILSSRDYDNFSNVLRYNDVKISKESMPQVNRIIVRFAEKKSKFRRGRDSHRHRRDFGRARKRRRY